MINEKKGAILILSGPSGCGKSTLLKEVYKDISDYYYMCKIANIGNEIYMKEMAFINKKSYEYTFNLFNPKKNIDKDCSYYENLYKVNKNKIKERVV